MGTPIPVPDDPPPTPGDDQCLNGWGPGEVWENFETPFSFTVDVSGINHGPNWQPFHGDIPDFRAVLEQPNPAAPCNFVWLDNPLYLFTIDFDLAVTNVHISMPPAIAIFAGSVLNGETLVTSFLSNVFEGGSVKMYLP